MLEVQAVLGRIQLRRMADWTAARTRNAAVLARAVAPFAGEGGPVRLPAFRCATCPGCSFDTGCRHAQYKFYFYSRPESLPQGWTRDRIIAEITARGVPAYQGSCSEVYLEKAFDGTGWRPAERLPVAQALGETSVMLLVHPTLTEAEMAKSAAVLAEVLGSIRLAVAAA